MGKLETNLINLYLDTSLTSTPTWKMLACLDTSTLDLGGDNVAANSKCGPDSVPGVPNYTFPFGGFAELAPGSSQVSIVELIALRKSGALAHWKFSTADGTDYYREFNGRLTAYNEDAPSYNALKFTATIAISGDVITEAPPVVP